MERRKEEDDGVWYVGDLTLEEELAAVTAEMNRPIPPDELARRRMVIQGIRKLREEIGPIGIPVTELIREARREAGDG